MLGIIQEILDPRSLLIETIYNSVFEIAATWITYKLVLKPMLVKLVKKELENDRND